MLDLSDRYIKPENAIELRAFTHGLMPRSVPDMLKYFADDWATRGADAWNQIPNHWTCDPDKNVGWWHLPAFLGDTFISPLLGAPEGTCILQPNLHWTMQCVLSSPELWNRGTEVLVTENEFPSVLHSVNSWARMLDKEVRTLKGDGKGIVSLELLQDSITQQTALIVLSHVGFATGALRSDNELAALTRSARSKNALFLLDGYHAASTKPVDVQKLGVDLYAGGLLKEASGSSGNAFVFIREGLSLSPRVSGWFGDAEPFAFGREHNPHPTIRRRFLGGTTAIAPCYHSVEGLRILLDIGLNAIREDSLEKTSYIIQRIQNSDVAIHSPTDPKHRSAMVILQVSHADRLCRYLKTRGVYTDSRQDTFLRMAPFVWNSENEMEHAVDILLEALSSEAYLDSNLPDESGPVT